MTGKPSCWESAASGLGQANMVLLCTSCTRRGLGEQDHLGGEVTEYVLQQVVLKAQPRAPSPLQGSEHLPSSHIFFKARTVHPIFINAQQNSVILRLNPIICSSGICKLLKCKADTRASPALTPKCDPWTLLRKDYFLVGCVKWERGCWEWEQQHVLPPGLGTQLREQQLHSGLDLIKEMRSGENHSI